MMRANDSHHEDCASGDKKKTSEERRCEDRTVSVRGLWLKEEEQEGQKTSATVPLWRHDGPGSSLGLADPEVSLSSCWCDLKGLWGRISSVVSVGGVCRLVASFTGLCIVTSGELDRKLSYGDWVSHCGGWPGNYTPFIWMAFVNKTKMADENRQADSRARILPEGRDRSKCKSKLMQPRKKVHNRTH